MRQSSPLQRLRVALVAVGVLLLLAGGLMLVWPSGWRWHPYHPYYEQMILGVYATLGVFLVRAGRDPDPLRHASLIWFTVWSSVVHGGIMLAQALTGSDHFGHLIGDVPALFLIAGILGVMTRQAARADVASP